MKGCEKPVHSKSLCMTHYQRKRRYGNPNITLQKGWSPGTDLLERFFYYVTFKNGCWLWNGSKTGGYGIIGIGGKNVRAGRFSYETFVEPLGSLMALHKEICSNPACVKPSHLYAGTHTQNMKDAAEWGALKNPRPGEENNSSKLKNADILEIRRLWGSKGLNQQQIADKFRVHYSNISRICSRITWSHI